MNNLMNYKKITEKWSLFKKKKKEVSINEKK